MHVISDSSRNSPNRGSICCITTVIASHMVAAAARKLVSERHSAYVSKVSSRFRKIQQCDVRKRVILSTSVSETACDSLATTTDSKEQEAVKLRSRWRWGFSRSTEDSKLYWCKEGVKSVRYTPLYRCFCVCLRVSRFV